MAEVLPEMMAHGRPLDPHFEEHEELYRRFSPDKLDGDEISIFAVALPDMSVIRQKYGRPHMLLLEEEYADWGALAFLVRDIPPNRKLWHEGVIAYTLEPHHVPQRQNYPHSEVRVFRGEARICRDNHNEYLLDPDFHLRWRESIVLASHVAVYPARPG